MKILSAFRDYATTDKLYKAVKRPLSPEYTVRRTVNEASDDMFIISSDRAELMSIVFKVYPRSFDMWVLDAYGRILVPVQSYYGHSWRVFIRQKMSRIIELLNKTWVEDGHIINLSWNRMMHEIAYPDISNINGYAYISINAAKAMDLLCRNS